MPRFPLPPVEHDASCRCFPCRHRDNPGIRRGFGLALFSGTIVVALFQAWHA